MPKKSTAATGLLAARLPQFSPYPSDRRPIRSQTPYIVHRLFRVGDVGMLVGGANVGKSTSIVHMTQSVARGLPWFERQTATTDVLYCCAEAPEAIESQERAWLGHNSQAPTGRIIYEEAPFDFDDEKHVEAFLEMVRKTEATHGLKFRLIVFDTLSDYLGNVDENSNSEMRLVNHALRHIAVSTGCCVLLIHHFGKDEGRGPRGAQCLNAKLDFRVDCWSEGDQTCMKVGKLRRGKKGDIFTARREEIVIGIDNFGELETGCVMVEQTGALPASAMPKGPDIGQSILDILSARSGAIIWSDVRQSLKKLGLAVDEAGRVMAERARNKLVADKKISYDKASKRCTLLGDTSAATQPVAGSATQAAPAANDDGLSNGPEDSGDGGAAAAA